MRPGEPYHFGYLVPDLAAAMPRYEAMLGVRFRDPMRRSLTEGTGPERSRPEGESFEVLFTYSIAASQPYVELMQMGPGWIFRPQLGEGFHHVGVWAPDLAEMRSSLVAQGAEIEARYFNPDGGERVCFANLGGTRFELVTEAIRPETEAWLSGDGSS